MAHTTVYLVGHSFLCRCFIIAFILLLLLLLLLLLFLLLLLLFKIALIKVVSIFLLLQRFYSGIILGSCSRCLCNFVFYLACLL